MILSYTILTVLETRILFRAGLKGQLVLYLALMTVSLAIWIANGYVEDMPSPANPIKDFVLYLTGG